jgi:hypothetical protein
MQAADMGDDTSIRVSEELAEELYERKGRSKTYEEFIWELLEKVDNDERAETGQETVTDSQGGARSDDESLDDSSNEIGDLRAEMEAALEQLHVKGRANKVERTRRQAIKYAWERLREEGSMRPRDIANDTFGAFFDNPDLGYSTAGGDRYAGYQMWDNCVREVLKQLPGVHQSGRTWQFKEPENGRQT